ncbi:hypothetical protein PM082_021684 [Marasmius tenuissimus]|nr:hypothetical protein PM082_021684 [Marasmius tenuissimus]
MCSGFIYLYKSCKIFVYISLLLVDDQTSFPSEQPKREQKRVISIRPSYDLSTPPEICPERKNIGAPDVCADIPTIWTQVRTRMETPDLLPSWVPFGPTKTIPFWMAGYNFLQLYDKSVRVSCSVKYSRRDEKLVPFSGFLIYQQPVLHYGLHTRYISSPLFVRLSAQGKFWCTRRDIVVFSFRLHRIGPWIDLYAVVNPVPSAINDSLIALFWATGIRYLESREKATRIPAITWATLTRPFYMINHLDLDANLVTVNLLAQSKSECYGVLKGCINERLGPG